jgi:hypothetical protein
VQNRLRFANRWCEYAAAMVSNSGAQRTIYGNANLELSRRSLATQITEMQSVFLQSLRIRNCRMNGG